MRAYEHFQVNLLTANYKKTHHRRKWSFLASVGATSQGQSKKISPIAGDGNFHGGDTCDHRRFA